MVDSINVRKLNNTQTAGFSVIKKEFKRSGVLKSLDSQYPKRSGFLTSEIFVLCCLKNIANIETFSEASEKFCNIPEHSMNLNRTTISRSCKNIGHIEDCNIRLQEFALYFLKRNHTNAKNIQIIVDATTIEVSKKSSYEGASWVWDNAQSKTVWGYYVTIIALSLKGVFLPVYFSFGDIKNNKLLVQLLKIKELSKSNIVIFDGGYGCDEFYENLTKNKFQFFTKVKRNWIFNNGLSESVELMREKLNLKNSQSKYLKVYRVKNNTVSKVQYTLCFRNSDNRNLLTNIVSPNLLKNIVRTAFLMFKIRWDIETCNKELKENFCFEKLPVRNLQSITGYLFSSIFSLCLLTFVKLKHKLKLGSLFNKGFKLFIRKIILTSANWIDQFDKIKLVIEKEKRWFYSDFI